MCEIGAGLGRIQLPGRQLPGSQYLCRMQNLIERDSRVIWHPFTPMLGAMPPLPIVKGKGALLFDEAGNGYIDAISSWWTNLHGHGHPEIAKSIYDQALQLEHVLFAGCTHPPAVELAEALLTLVPGDFEKCFYSDNGSTAVEVALKMSIQYAKNCGQVERDTLIAFRHSYHGDTFGAMSVSERGIFTLPFNDRLFDVAFVDTPNEENIERLLQELEALASCAICFIYEPLVQGAGGMCMYGAEGLNRILRLLKTSGVVCIADEVMTGFGRTGTLFASEQVTEKPDIICLSKGITGGSLPLACTLANSKIIAAFRSADWNHTFFHGHSYTANPIACAAALCSLALLKKDECQHRIQTISAKNLDFAARLADHPTALFPRSRGTILAFELRSRNHEYLNKIREETIQYALAQGVFMRPLGNTIYTMPPYCITDEELNQVYAVLHHCAEHLDLDGSD